MTSPLFFVVARVVSRDGALEKWRDRLTGLCAVSKTEPYSNSYYWGNDLDGEPDTLWGLEGYYHPVGFFMNHVSSDVFKEEMEKVDNDKLLRTRQGLGSPDYDLHHYDFFSGFIKREDDKNADAEDSFVVVLHFWAHDGKRKQLLDSLAAFSDTIRASEKGPAISTQSLIVLKEVNDTNMATLYIRTKDTEAWEKFNDSGLKDLETTVGSLVMRREIHKSQAFIGHIGQDAPRRAS